MGSSGGTTDVRIKVHSKKSLYLFLLGSSVPANTRTHVVNKPTAPALCHLKCEHATKQELTFHPDVGGSDDGEDEQKHDEHERFHVVGRHSLHPEQDGSQQFSLRGAEAVAQDVRDAPIIARCKNQVFRYSSNFTMNWDGGNVHMKPQSSPFSPGPVLLGGECCTTLVPPLKTCNLL